MDKDIDDLLDEVESKYVKGSKKPDNSTSKPVPTLTSTSTTTKSKPKQRSTVDDAISDILDLDIDLEDGKTQKKGVSGANVPAHATASNGFSGRKETTKKCFPVFLGGSGDETGLGTTVKTRACDEMRCTNCDFRICHFDDLSWKPDTDYLFLRNNVPNFQKLKSNLRRKKGCRAYCCQCTWRDVTSLQEISDPKLKWVCGKHAL